MSDKLDTIAHRTMCAALAYTERRHAESAMLRLASADSHSRIRRPGHGAQRAQSVEVKRLRRALRAAERWEAQARAYGAQ